VTRLLKVGRVFRCLLQAIESDRLVERTAWRTLKRGCGSHQKFSASRSRELSLK